MTTNNIAAVACLCGFAAMIPNIKADAADKKTTFTFSAPVEIPGQVLPAGTYVFKVLTSTGTRSVVQVFNKDENHIIGTFLTIPDYEMKTPDKPLIRFEERAAGSPEAIRSWFYPDDNYGNEFVYPKVRAVELANQSQQNVPSMPSELASNTTQATSNQNDQQVEQMKDTALKAERPSGDEDEVAAVFVTVAPAVAITAAPVAAVPVAALVRNDSPAALPATASPLPFIGLIGLLFACGGIALRAGSRKIS
jgi:hypothetical protein